MMHTKDLGQVLLICARSIRFLKRAYIPQKSCSQPHFVDCGLL